MNSNYSTYLTRVVILLLICFFISMALVAQQNPLVREGHKEDHTEVSFPKAEQFSNTQLSYKIIPAPGNTFGYDVYADGRLMIHQGSIPAMPGNEGFKTKTAAEKIAQLVIQKIKKGEMPPTIDMEELKKLKVI